MARQEYSQREVKKGGGARTFLSIWVCVFFLVPMVALGGEVRELRLEVGYAGSAVSFNLYKNDVFVCNNILVDSQLACNVELDATQMSFVLTAVDATGMESPPSLPFILEPLPQDNSAMNAALFLLIMD